MEMVSFLLPTQERAHCPPGTITWISTAVSTATYQKQAASDLLLGILMSDK